MESEFIYSATTIIVVIVSRVLSHFEHKKSNKEIKVMLNGSLEKKVDELVKKSIKKQQDGISKLSKKQ